ncbi:MAG: hypothetical protein JNK56_39310, partial [Myxococcales bacterium]|nr:hypothetical protein [Myxococcales bacterium]
MPRPTPAQRSRHPWRLCVALLAASPLTAVAAPSAPAAATPVPKDSKSPATPVPK